MTIIHRTPGLLDIRAVTTLGLSAKPNSTNPIGKFGTGLKYAIAVLVRMGAELTIYIGKDQYEFFCTDEDFRGKPFKQIKMRLKKWSWTKRQTIDLPFTTEYGLNWTAWMAFRELEANTRDENGMSFNATTYQSEGVWDSVPDQPEDNHTLIVIDHPEYDAAYEDRDSVFLPTAAVTHADASQSVQVLEGRATRLYYRGMRTYDTTAQSMYTYNIVQDVQLTEDRTFRSEGEVKQLIAGHVLRSDDEVFIESIVTAHKSVWEHELPFPDWIQPSQAFRNVMARNPKGRSTASSSYYSRHDDTPYSVPTTTIWDVHPRPWKLQYTTIIDAKGKPVMDAPYGYQGKWDTMAALFLTNSGFDKPVGFMDVKSDKADEELDALVDAIIEEDF